MDRNQKGKHDIHRQYSRTSPEARIVSIIAAGGQARIYPDDATTRTFVPEWKIATRVSSVSIHPRRTAEQNETTRQWDLRSRTRLAGIYTGLLSRHNGADSWGPRVTCILADRITTHYLLSMKRLRVKIRVRMCLKSVRSIPRFKHPQLIRRTRASYAIIVVRTPKGFHNLRTIRRLQNVVSAEPHGATRAI